MPTDTSIFLSTAGTAMGMAFLIEGLKKLTWFPWLTAETAKLNRVVGIVVAGAVAFGIHIAWDDTARTPDSIGTLSIVIPTLGGFLHGCWNWFVQWSLQQYGYRVAVKGSR